MWGCHLLSFDTVYFDRHCRNDCTCSPLGRDLKALSTDIWPLRLLIPTGKPIENAIYGLILSQFQNHVLKGRLCFASGPRY